ncbi:MAG: hypothetical protein HZA08_13795 [Nitrospirae bacterium]|nr:hypothetical protein [Nitrospirota bacterium]
MSCYFRNLKDIFEELGINVTKENKKAVDQAIHSLVSVTYKNCSPTWKEVKARIRENPEERTAFMKNLKDIISKKVK